MEKYTCKYCGKQMKKVMMPVDSDWNVDYQYICLNDDCSYYVDGWKWMSERFRVRASYRFRTDPFSGSAGPIPVSSPGDLKHYVAE